MTGPECLQPWRKKQYSLGMNQSLKGLRRLPHLPEHAKTPELEEPTEQSDAPSPSAPLPMATDSHGNWSWNTRRAQHRARPQHLLTPDPDNPNDWVWAYVNEREELLSWWQEFRSLHHKGTRSLSNSPSPRTGEKSGCCFQATCSPEGEE